MRRTLKPGDKCGRLLILKRDGKYAICRCRCGETKRVRADHLGKCTQSCGCLNREIAAETARSRSTHGNARRGMETRAYKAWKNMQMRCKNPNAPGYSDYGGRGITIEYGSFEEFLADVGPRPAGMEIDRVDNDGNYAPGNCRWATRRDQSRNTRRTLRVTFRGDTRTLVDWCEQLGLPYFATYQRLRSGWSAERALTEPVRSRA